jgi:hypothetical protein
VKKQTTQAVLNANKANAQKSAGPRTAAGKLTSSQNAITHGFFSKELVLNDEETQQLEVLRRGLHKELAPNTFMQSLQFGQIMVCVARSKLALRLEMRHINRVLCKDSSTEAQHTPERPGSRPEWFLSGRQGLRDGIRLIAEVKQEFLSLGRIDQKWSVPLDESFGPQLRQLLTDWIPSNKSAVLLADNLIQHQANTGLPLTPLKTEKGTRVILDRKQMEHMVIKLLDLEQSLLLDLLNSFEQRVSISTAQKDAVDYAPRYFSAACRDLHREFEWYMHLKKENK